MQTRLPYISLLLVPYFIVSTACSSDNLKADIPAYVSIPAFELETDYTAEGTAHSKFTTAWIFYNNEPVGAFELPCVVPVITNEAPGELLVYPGISMNGIDATRAIYSFCEPVREQVNLATLDTFYFNAGSDSIPKTRYADNTTVVIVEDFDQSGINLEPTSSSDTSVVVISDDAHTFEYPGEDNGRSGLLTVAQQISRVEVRSSDSYILPRGRDVFLELTYKSNNSLLIGVLADEGVLVPRSSLLLRSSNNTWNKIYVNLINEISASNQGTPMNLLFGALLDEGVDTAKIYVDNLKLVY